MRRATTRTLAVAALAVVAALAAALPAAASWTDGEVLVGQAQALNDQLEDARATVGEGLGEAQTALGSVVGMKNSVLSGLSAAAGRLVDDGVATALGGQTALSGIAQTALQTGSLLTRRVASGVGGALQQAAEQPEAVVGAFQGGRVAGSGILPAGAAYGTLPTVAGTTAALQGLVPTPGSVQNEMAVKDAAIAGLATALAQQQQGGAVVDGGGDGGGAVVVDGSGGGDPSSAPPVTVVSAASGPPPPTLPTISPAERRFYDAVSSTLAGALRAVPVVSAASAPAPAAIAPAPPAVQQMQAIPIPAPFIGGGGASTVANVAVPAGSTVIPTVYQAPGGFVGGGGIGGGGGSSNNSSRSQQPGGHRHARRRRRGVPQRRDGCCCRFRPAAGDGGD